MRTDGRAFVLAPEASILRRRLGATAWAVFEELLALSTGTCEAAPSARSLATALGLSKDTVTRALAKLRQAKLIAPIQERTPAGAFAQGRYAIAVPDCVALVGDASQAARVRSAHPKPRVTRRTGSRSAISPSPGRAQAVQLALIDLDATTL